ncbi:hypothetical protein [Salmonirosea aquatica]|uniref:hypothetical protein n=1 Tax=Salmonirosea aquatica TaxID=2654236 RepID=UPI003570B8C1
MEMLIFFFISLFAGILAAYFVEYHSRKQSNQYTYGRKQDLKSMVNHLQKISRQF